MINLKLGRLKNMLNSLIKYGSIKNKLHSFLETTKYSQIFILVDENTKQLCLPLLPKFDYTLIEIESGEKNKNIDSCQLIWSKLLSHNADRKTLLINLGGGVISDMGGFCASTFKRGIDFVNIPTTLLAMVDATIGGKTGIDYGFQKNMIGLFSLAQSVFIDNSFLNTLDKRQIKSGKAEMLKHGLIANEQHFEQVLTCETPKLDLIKASIAIKQEIVNADPYEKGLRKSLNFGHTLGHALETFYLENNKDILHGEAIAQGMIWALQLSVKHTNFNEKKAQKAIFQIKAIFDEISLSNEEYRTIINLAKNDKKNTHQQINFCLLSAIGQCDINIALSEAEILSTLLK